MAEQHQGNSQKPALIFYRQALLAEKRKDYKKALELYKMALKTEPQFFESWLNAGAIYSRAGDSDKAILCYQKAIMTRHDKRAFYNLASEYFKTGDYEKSRKLLIKALNYDTRFIQAHLLLGYTYGKLQKNNEAEKSIKQVLKLDPRNRAALTALALLYFHNGRHDLCKKYVDILSRNKVKDIVVERLKANLSLAEGDIEQSLMKFHEIADTDPKLKKFYKSYKATQTGEQKQNLQVKKENLESKKNKTAKDNFDLSLLSLFDGDFTTAIEYLTRANNQSI